MKKLLILLAIAFWQPAAAQMFKCTDAKGKVTYSNSKCSDLGLKDGGEVRDRLNINPAYRPPARPLAPAATPAAAPQNVQAPVPEAAQEPERRCFTVAGAGGKKVTRCNDKPDEPGE